MEEYPPMPTKISGDVIAIGDIHARWKGFQNLWQQLEQNIPDFENKWVVFLGDYLDRGRDGPQVLEFLTKLWLTRPKTTFLCGNHDLALATFLKLYPEPVTGIYSEMAKEHFPKSELQTGPEFTDMHLQGRRYTKIYDSSETFKSFNVQYGDQKGLIDAFPQKYKVFYQKLPWMVDHPQYIFVHAGFPKDIPWQESLDKLRERDFSLSRPPWIHSRGLIEAPSFAEKTIVSGHVARKKVTFFENRILVDTTGGKSHDISAIWLPHNHVFQAFQDPPQRTAN